ncbi:hypothetical protein TeGR_g15004 [Tetraparma gracilis]|uniref:Uncharacterized protein n=1 Tax=Tetraparma gracilis TaxID=2962635 RepID=A0ABQ6NDR5_9STRA|nr:hypothetical protein TeGR_g15004 [Tetraparma gracilis]
MSRRETNRAVASVAGLRLARPSAPGAAAEAAPSSSAAMPSSTPFGSSRLSRAAPGAAEEAADADTSAAASASDWCGPFSVARRLINKREAARADREEKLREEAGAKEEAPRTALDEEAALLERRRRERLQPLLAWKPSFGEGHTNTRHQFESRKRQYSTMASASAPAVPSLSELCVSFLTANFAAIESLGGLDSASRNQLSAALAETNSLTDDACATVAGLKQEDEYYGAGALHTLEIPDGASLTAPGLLSLAEALFERDAPASHGIAVGHAGVAAASSLSDLLSSPPLEDRLDILSLSGAYTLPDSGFAAAVSNNLRSLAVLRLDTCPLLGPLLGSALAKLSRLEELSLENCNAGVLPAMLSSPPAFLSTLTSLSLRGAADLNDELLSKLLPLGGGVRVPLEHLDLSSTGVTDASLSRARRSVGGTLASLTLNLCRGLTAAGLEVFFAPGAELGPPVRLRKAVLSGLGCVRASEASAQASDASERERRG